MESSKQATALKAVKDLTWWEMKEEATNRGIPTNGVSKPELYALLTKVRNSFENSKEFASIKKPQQPGLSTTKYVAVSPEIASVMDAKAIDKKPQLSVKSVKKLDSGKTTKELVKPQFGARHSVFPIRTTTDPEINNILDLECKKHIKIYKLSILSIPNKQIAEFCGTNSGHVWNILNDYKKHPEKVTASDLIK